jgi:hypothetical protein
MTDKAKNHPENDHSRIDHLMSARMTRWLGVTNLATGVLGLAALVAAYGLAEHLIALQEAAPEGTLATQPVRFLGVDVSVTLSMSVLLLGAASGLVGSAIQQSIIFANRSGHRTLESGWAWWYVLRPVWSSLLGAVFVIAVNAGLVSIGDQTTSTAGATVLATIGALAGLFTDKVLEKLGDLLGATPTTKVAGSTSPEPVVP